MKKSLMGLVASAVVCSMAFGSPTANEPSFSGLNATEHAALFGEGVTAQAVALDGAEMKATEGEFIIRGGRLLMSTLWTYANAPAWNNSRVYSRPLTNSNRYAGGGFIYYR